MNPTGNARRLRRKQTREEAQLWQTLRAGRFAGFKFRRQHPLGGYFLDFYCTAARLVVELDGFEHGLPRQQERDVARDQFLAAEGVEELRFWNHQWRSNREGVLWEIWHALQRRTGCLQVMRKMGNNRFVPPPVEKLGKKPDRKPSHDLRIRIARARMNGGVVRIQGLLSLALSSKGGEGNTAAATEHRDACKEQAKGQSIATAAPQLQVFAVSAPVCS